MAFRGLRLVDQLALAQGGYLLATGVCSIVHMPSFEAVTGHKVDRWLVKTVGALAAAIGATLALAAYRRTAGPEAALLAVGSASGFAAIDGVYVARRRISPVYLLDAVLELGFIAAWVASRGDWARPGAPARAAPRG